MRFTVTRTTSSSILTRVSSSVIWFIRNNNCSCTRKHTIRVFLAFLVYLAYINVSSRKKVDLPNTFYAELDRDLDTSAYLSEYSKFNELRRHRIKQEQGDDSSSRFGLKRVVKDKRSRKSMYKKEYTVLMFTSVFQQEKFCDTKKQQEASSLYVEQCPYKNCRFTCDRNRARHADSVLFHAFDLLSEETETKVFLKNFLARVNSRKDQIWILWHDEVSFSINFALIKNFCLILVVYFQI